MKKIVTFRAASFGDTLLAKYLFENLRVQHPDARYVIITGSRAPMLRELLEAYQWIEIKEINRRHPLKIVQSFLDLRGADLVVIPTSYGVFSTPSKLFGRLIAARGAFWGYDDGSFFSRVLYDLRFKRDHDRPVIENELEIVRALKINPSLDKPTFAVDSPNEDVIKNIGLKSEHYLVINLFSGSPKRGLSSNNRQRLVSVIAENTLDYKLVLIGGPQNRTELETLSLPERACIITGPVQQMLQLLHFSKAVVSVDTGVAHISSGLGKKLLVLSSYAGRGWWTEAQHSDSTHVIIGERGVNEKGDKQEYFPESLNNFSNNAIAQWIKSLKI